MSDSQPHTRHEPEVYHINSSSSPRNNGVLENDSDYDVFSEFTLDSSPVTAQNIQSPSHAPSHLPRRTLDLRFPRTSSTTNIEQTTSYRHPEFESPWYTSYNNNTDITLPSFSSAFPDIMPSRNTSTHQAGFVDLTEEYTSPTIFHSSQPLTRPDPLVSSATNNMPRPSIKRQKLSTGEHISLGQAPEEVERVDLVEDQDSLAIQKQRADQIKAQQEASNKPIRLSTLTCVICLDNPTDLTATSCGHLFCHTCIMESLIAGENRAVAGEAKRSQCPVCRKNLSRTKAGDIIPLLMKKGLASQPRKSRTPGDP